MNLKELDSYLLSNLISAQVERVSCIECCKYYIAPETAPCGHSLCHGCWSGRRTCPYCEAAITRRALHLNMPLRHRTEHVQSLTEQFEKLFDVKLADIHFDTDIVQPVLPKDPIKQVNDWLTSSTNHFSAPMINSQSHCESQTLMDAPAPITLDGSKIQIHTHTKKITSPKKVVLPLHSQDDWDKIEAIPDTEELVPKNKGTIAGPMDIEPYIVDENEYSNEHPRRSNRKKDVKVPERVTRTRSRSVEKFSYKHCESETDKKSTKPKQNWSNVKKMKKEFNKLNKVNKNKLNISIEMSKKGQDNKSTKDVSGKDLLASKTPENKSSCIEDATNSDTMGTELVKSNIKSIVTNENLNPNVNDSNKNLEKNKSGIDKSKVIFVNKRVSKSLDIPKKTNVINKSLTTNKSDDLELASGDNQTSTEDLPQLQPNQDCKETAKSYQMPSFNRVSNQVSDIKVVQSTIDTNDTSDDVEISIKVGSTVTNILIKQKHKDITYKCKADSAIQTSLGPYNLQTDMCDKGIGVQSGVPKETSEKGINVNTIELELGDTNKVTINKVLTARVDTASAETATAEYLITESVEKEMSDAVDCVEEGIDKVYSAKSNKDLKSSQDKQFHKMTQDKIVEDLHDINDYDLFASGSVKDVHLLKNTNIAHSEILKPSLKIIKSQKEKRDRGVTDVTDLPKSKRQRVNSVQNNRPYTQKAVEDEHDSDPTYDKLMSQVFANIDADIQINKKSGRTLSLKHTEKDNHKNESEITQKTPRRTPKKVSCPSNDTKEQQHQKDSENIFSMLEITHQEELKKTQNNNVTSEENIISEKKNQPNVQTNPSTQQNIDSIITPGLCLGTFKTISQPDVGTLCDNKATKLYEGNEKDSAQDVEILDTLQACAQAEQDLETFRGETHTQEKMEEDLILLQPVLGTPMMEDDDSVVEETPQKDMSLQKPKPKSDIQNLDPRGVSDKSKSDIDISASVINITDTLTPVNSKADHKKDTAVVETAPKEACTETPMSITRFVDHIKHNSTPFAKKSLNFEGEGLSDAEQTLCPTNTQEREFMEKAFEKTQEPVKKPLMARNECVRNTSDFCIAGSCLTSLQLAKVRLLCRNKGWRFSEKYVDCLTHLVVSVNEECKSQRTLKYMCSLAASKWIVSYDWVEMCLDAKGVVPNEEQFEALDACGLPGPARSRMARCKLFQGITFYCIPPFTIMDIDTLKYLIQASGGRVTATLQDVRVTGSDVKILLAEPQTTQEDRFIYITMKEMIVPVNYEWVINCLGSYSLCSIKDLLLCPVALLSPLVETWPPVLVQETDDDDSADKQCGLKRNMYYLVCHMMIVPVNYEWVMNSLGSYSLCSIKDLLLCPVALLSPNLVLIPTNEYLI